MDAHRDAGHGAGGVRGAARPAELLRVPADGRGHLRPATAVAQRPAHATATTAGTYAPAWYALVGWPSLLLPPVAALEGMRVLAALVFAALVAIAAAGAWRAGARRWGLVGLALGLPPVAVHLGGGIHPSGTEIAAGVALWTCSAAVAVGARDAADRWRWGVAGVTLAVVRPLGPLLALAIPVACLLVLSSRSTAATDLPAWRDPRPRLAAAGIGVAAGVGRAGACGAGRCRPSAGSPPRGCRRVAVLRHSLGLVPERLVELVGVLGWADVNLPRVVTYGWLGAVAALALAGLMMARPAARLWLLGLAAAVVLLPVVADLRSASWFGFVWQGRYTLPIAAGVPVLCGLVVDRGGAGAASGAGRWRPPSWRRWPSRTSSPWWPCSAGSGSAPTAGSWRPWANPAWPSRSPPGC